MFAYRDAGHFYYPLFQYVQEEWAAGRVPLWNPYENLGQPLAADATSSVFYPGKLIFALPIGFAWAYKLYILAHVLLAAWAAYRLARHFGASVAAAGICCALLRLLGQRAVRLLQRGLPGRRGVAAAGRAGGRPDARRAQLRGGPSPSARCWP